MGIIARCMVATTIEGVKSKLVLLLDVVREEILYIVMHVKREEPEKVNH